MLILWLAGVVLAAEPSPPSDPPADPPVEPVIDVQEKGALWSGYGIPIFGANSIDGFGLGFSGEIFQRPRDQEFGYRFKLTASSWFTVSLDYTSQYAQAEYRGDAHGLFRFGYQTWRNMPYAGAGGADVSVDWEALEGGNRIRGPYVMMAGSKPFAPRWKAYGQVYLHSLSVSPASGGLLDQTRPFAMEGGNYGDLTVGIELDDTDRWPMPYRGGRAEIDTRFGLSGVPGGDVEPLVGVHGEVIRWWSGKHDRLTFGGRLLAEKSFGARPFFEQFVTGGRWRDELGYDQALVGYGRLRTRGDGVVAGLVEFRPHLVTVHPFKAELSFDLSVFAEQAWLFDGADPGPPMPSVGFGPDILWQRGSQLRPFVSWGWWSEEPGGDRAPRLLYGISVQDPL